MGAVKKFLHQSNLEAREKHHSRLFIDLAENIHIHHREYRTVFSLDEYFEYAQIVADSTQDVRNFLEQNPDYKEGAYPTTIMIAGGKERQLKFLGNSPNPYESAYYDCEFAIELQEEFVTDEIHIHYRDFRMGVDRGNFRRIAQGFNEALAKLDEFEENNSYIRQEHPDRVFVDSDQNSNEGRKAEIMGVANVATSQIKSFWYKDVLKDWKPDLIAISALRRDISQKKELPPIILSTEVDGSHMIIDGHHRYFAYLSEGATSCKAVITPLTFEASAKIREAEVVLKEFDLETGGKFDMSSFLKSYFAYRLNRYYAGSFSTKLKSQKLWYRIIRKLARIVLGRRYVFKKFFEAHNNHN